jgi:crotonobetainyl-CoA:carnitine CoA-transferase CaiB-like acyl-CoA transferase
MGSSNTLGQPNQAFRTRDGWVVISAINDEMWLRCARALGGQELADDPRFSELAGRYANRGQMLDEVQRRVELLSTSECVALLSAATVTAAPILTVGDTIASEQVAALGTLTQGQIGSATIPVVGSPIWVDGARVAGPTAIPELGADRDDVLADWVGRNARTRSGTEAVTAKESA